MKCFVLIWAALLVNAASHSELVVKIQQGFLRGTRITSERSHRPFIAFMGIPYAKPPVGELRFKAPQPPDSWDGIKSVILEGSVCPQTNEFTRNTEGDEDCLFLNVYTPKLPIGVNDTLIPVMVWIHGGGLAFGSGNRDSQGPDYLVDAGVVVVTFNYRLGILGFLSLQNAQVPGNNGLKDQVMALRWVQQNIAQFGGNPNNVTIFGNSAGAICVNLHMLSPMSRGLFHGAISQSGSVFMPWITVSREESLNNAIDAAKRLGLNGTSPEEVWQKFKYASLQDLLPLNGQLRFSLITDTMASEGEVFLPDYPKILVSTGHLHNVKFMAGFTSNEAIVMLNGQGRNQSVLIKTLQMRIGHYLAEICNSSKCTREITSKLEEFYFQGRTALNATLQQNLDLVRDAFFINGAYCATKKQLQASTSPVYLYQFSYSGAMSVYKAHYGYKYLPGASHADDIAYIFGTTFHNQSFVEGSPELVTSQRMVTMWTNFAKTGHPTPIQDPLLQNVTWPPVTLSDIPALNIDTDLSLKHVHRNGSVNFWEELLTNYTSHSLCG